MRMVNNLYMLYDNVSQSYISTPIVCPNKAVMLRNLKSLIKVNKFQFIDMIDDLKLFCVGTIDLNTGVIKSEIEFISNLSDLKE